jgi:hypothetical protein
MQCNRPTNREIAKRIAEAKQALEGQKGLFANPSKLVSEFYELNIGDSDQVWELIRELLNEISPENYAGAKPPLKSYEKSIVNCELIAFSWHSHRLGKKMYMKFALKKGRFYYVSLHVSRPKDKK